jgi:hypothetical protein
MIAALTLSLAVLPPEPTVDPYAVYERARAFWLTQTYAPYLTYRVAVTVTQGANTRVERYRSMFDATSSNSTIYADEVSDYELAHPVVPYGVNICILVCITKPLPPIDFIGVPLLTPTYTFGLAPFIRVPPPDSAQSAARLVAEIRRKFHDPYPVGRIPLAAPPRPPPTIAHVVTQAHQAYEISYAGSETVNGHTCYHLLLEPRADPHRYRLRELWVDVSTGATWRLAVALNFVRGPGTDAPWIVDFDNVDGVQYIDEETAERPLRYEGQTYSHTVVSFEDIQPVDALDPWDVLDMAKQTPCSPYDGASDGIMEEPAEC